MTIGHHGDVMLAAKIELLPFGPVVDQRVLKLVERDGNPGIKEVGELGGREIGGADVSDLALTAQVREHQRRFHRTGTSAFHQKNCTTSRASTPRRFNERSMIRTVSARVSAGRASQSGTYFVWIWILVASSG